MSPCKPCFLSLCCTSSPLSPIWMAGKSPQTDGQLPQPTLSLLLRLWVSVCVHVCVCARIFTYLSCAAFPCVLMTQTDDRGRNRLMLRQAAASVKAWFLSPCTHLYNNDMYIDKKWKIKKHFIWSKNVFKSAFPSLNCKTFTYLHHRISRVFRTADVYMNWVRGHYSELLFTENINLLRWKQRFLLLHSKWIKLDLKKWWLY